jgi:hypothetical protein
MCDTAQGIDCMQTTPLSVNILIMEVVHVVCVEVEQKAQYCKNHMKMFDFFLMWVCAHTSFIFSIDSIKSPYNRRGID